MSAWDTGCRGDGGTVAAQDEVEQFAALLRRLKDRTDRSYGSLARRLNMNTSTLHRYCAGEAVPQDFAPLERLAAFCAATPEERLELHRLWLLAVAARRRIRTPEETETTPGPAPVAEETARVREQAAAHHPWFRRRRTLVGAAAATALLATLGTVSALTEDGTRDGSARAPSGQSRTTEAGAPDAPSTGADSPSPGATSASPSTGGTASHTPPAQGAPAVQDKAPASGGVPLSLTVDSQVWQGGCGENYVIDKTPARVPPPPTPQDAAAWAATQGAVQGRQSMVQISVQGKSSTAVVLNALRVRVVSRGTPVPGRAYSMDQGCGGGLTPSSFAVNLDVNRPIAHPVPGTNDGGKPPPAVPFPFRVSAQDPQVLLVTATTEAYDAGWYLELDWSSQGRTGTVRIDDHGRPFRTSAIKGMPRYWYGTNDAGERAWVPY
ncbi:helix-turn-helix domain-containing protein [Streptomyces sp. NPDC101152]|uniref:helix-turn-helix domain-containing protein n=1 Tax=Streptomyces sp. NPDC101152 TaxID=3366116 RepID=UPI0037F2665C